jgi:hypothetical protein
VKAHLKKQKNKQVEQNKSNPSSIKLTIGTDSKYLYEFNHK